MAPFSNRIADGEYEFGGRRRLLGITERKNHNAIHGFAHSEVFKLGKAEEADTFAKVSLECNSLRPGIFEGYEFSVDLSVSFTLCERALFMEIEGRNTGRSAAPFACGWHPYFKTSDKGIDHLELAIPCEYVIMTDARLLPLPGEQARCPAAQRPDLDFRSGPDGRGKALGSRKLDVCFGGLQTDPNGYGRTVLHDPENGLDITVFQEGGLMHVYTGDTLLQRPRKSVALEPVQFMTNSFNQPECRQGITLAPGKTSVFRCGVEARLRPLRA
jgi:aldose 1-epimerase